MNQKFFYVVEHAIPFPRSEYGGIWNVIAESDQECFDLISNTDEYKESNCEKYFSNLMENVNKSPRFLLADSEESRIVDCFVT